MKFRTVLAILLLACVCERAVAQTDIDNPKIPLDTIATASDAKIILYTDNTWSYYFPDYALLTAADVFHENWNTEMIFAYRGQSQESLPETIELKLIDQIGDYHTPHVGKVFSKYGIRGRRKHSGVDVPLHKGEPVYAAFAGKVRYAKFNSGGYGNLVIIRHSNGLETWYAHLSKLNVQPNEYVVAGAVIGLGGSTGRSRGPHLHFETRYHDLTFDPEFLIDFENDALHYQTFALEKSYFDIRSNAKEVLEDDSEDFDASSMLASADGEQLTSEEIVENIEKTEQRKTEQKAAQVAKANEPVYHTVRNGDTLGGLAVKYHTRVSTICRLNSNLTPQTTLKLGRKIRVK